jgi:hypothetical protein
LLGFRERQRLQQDRIEDGKDGGVGADSQREGKNRDQK